MNFLTWLKGSQDLQPPETPKSPNVIRTEVSSKKSSGQNPFALIFTRVRCCGRTQVLFRQTKRISSQAMNSCWERSAHGARLPAASRSLGKARAAQEGLICDVHLGLYISVFLTLLISAFILFIHCFLLAQFSFSELENNNLTHTDAWTSHPEHSGCLELLTSASSKVRDTVLDIQTQQLFLLSVNMQLFAYTFTKKC